MHGTDTAVAVVHVLTELNPIAFLTPSVYGVVFLL